MEWGNDQVRGCPKCRYIYVQETLLAENLSNEERWTDGLQRAYALGRPPLAVYCPLCKDWFLNDQGRKLFEIPPYLELGALERLSFEDDMSSRQLRKALESSSCQSKEKDLRLRLWQQENQQLSWDDSIDLELREENMEQLLELCKEDPLIVAEVHRQLGHFQECLSLLNSLESNEEEPAKTIAAHAEAGLTEVALLGAIPSKPLEPQNMDLKAMSAHGFVPLPDPYDIWAYPGKDKPDLYLAQKNDQGQWLAYFSTDGRYQLRYNRYFTKEEWVAFQGLDPQWQEELQFHWQFHSWEPPRDELDRRKYYSVAYRHRMGLTDYPSYDSISKNEPWIEEYWKTALDDMKEHHPEEHPWLLEEASRLRWRFFWEAVSKHSDMNYCYLDLHRYYCEEHQQHENWLSRARDVMANLDRVSRGGFPRWFQGHDMTPRNSKESPLDFVGQFWTDDLGFGPSKLVYLFFDPSEGLLEQVFDYD